MFGLRDQVKDILRPEEQTLHLHIVSATSSRAPPVISDNDWYRSRGISGIVSLPPKADRKDVHRRPRERHIPKQNQSPPYHMTIHRLATTDRGLH